jgi:chromosome segregation ATPase
MAQLNELLDTAAQTAEALSAEIRVAREALAEIERDVPDIEHRIDEAVATSRARLAAMTERLQHWEDDLDRADAELASAREAVAHGADTTREAIEEAMSTLRGDVDDLVETRIPKVQEDVGGWVHDRLGDMDHSLDALRAHGQRVEQHGQELTAELLPRFQAAIAAAGEAIAGAHAEHEATLAKVDASTQEAQEQLVAGMLATVSDLQGHAQGSTQAIQEKLEEAHELSLQGFTDGTEQLRDAQDQMQAILQELMLHLQVEMQHRSQLFEMLTKVMNSQHETSMAAIQNMR